MEMNSTVQHHYQALTLDNYRKSNKLFAIVFVVQWVFVILISLLVTPKTWIGSTSVVHIHVISAVVAGGLLSIGPLVLIRMVPEASITRYVIAASQMLYSTLIIHIMGGRIEAHFHIFGGLAVLAFYRDWRVLLVATAVAGVDHIVRGLFLPQSIYGVSTPQLARTLEHIGWVVFEDVFLFWGLMNQLSEMKGVSKVRAMIEDEQQKTRDLLSQSAEQLKTGAQLATAMENSLAKLKELEFSANGLSESEETLGVASDSITEANAASNEQMVVLAASAEDQASHVTESSSAIEQIVANIGSINNIIQNQMSTLESASAAMQDAENQSAQLMANINTLGDSSDQIREIISVIANVASQTELLAMNAAIEAAHAGDSGKGFSVVAGEIRKLSEQTKLEVGRINSQVESITGMIREAYDGVVLTSKTFKTASGSFSSMDQAFRNIAQANAELSLGGNEILQSISMLTEITEQVSGLSSAGRAAAEKVTDQVHNLQMTKSAVQSSTNQIFSAIESLSISITEAAEVATSLDSQLQSISKFIAETEDALTEAVGTQSVEAQSVEEAPA